MFGCWEYFEEVCSCLYDYVVVVVEDCDLCEVLLCGISEIGVFIIEMDWVLVFK